MSYYDQVKEAAEAIRSRVPEIPQIGVVLGSGLGDFASSLDAAVTMPYGELPHWPASRVGGHEAKLVVGKTGFSQGALMVIDDHINLMGSNPLGGENDERFGARFPDMTEVYSSRLRGIADRQGKAINLLLPHGIYAGVLGPSYETPAEIRYLRT